MFKINSHLHGEDCFIDIDSIVAFEPCNQTKGSYYIHLKGVSLFKAVFVEKKVVDSIIELLTTPPTNNKKS